MSRWYENWIKFMCTAHNWIISSLHFHIEALYIVCCCRFFLHFSLALFYSLSRPLFAPCVHIRVYLHLIRLALHCNTLFAPILTFSLSFWFCDLSLVCSFCWVGLVSDPVQTTNEPSQWLPMKSVNSDGFDPNYKNQSKSARDSTIHHRYSQKVFNFQTLWKCSPNNRTKRGTKMTWHLLIRTYFRHELHVASGSHIVNFFVVEWFWPLYFAVRLLDNMI